MMKRIITIGALVGAILLSACQPTAGPGKVQVVGSWRVQYKSISGTTHLSCEYAEDCYTAAPGKVFAVVQVSVRYTGSGTGEPAWDLAYSLVGSNHVVYDEQFTCGAEPVTECDAPGLKADGLTSFGVVFELPAGKTQGGQLEVTDYDTTATWSLYSS
jgi:predicted small secreted protein